MESVLQKVLILQQKTDKLENFIHLLLQEHTQLEDDLDAVLAENERLKARVAELEVENQEVKNAYHELSQQSLQNWKTYQLLGDLEDKEALKTKIDNYLQEIDNCLQLLGESNF